MTEAQVEIPERYVDSYQRSGNFVRRIIEELGAAEAKLRQLSEMKKGAKNLIDAMETCHSCRGTVLVDEYPTHCEDCPASCDDHDEPDCPSIYDLHRALKALCEQYDLVPRSDAISLLERHAAQTEYDARKFAELEARIKELEICLEQTRGR